MGGRFGSFLRPLKATSYGCQPNIRLLPGPQQKQANLYEEPRGTEIKRDGGNQEEGSERRSGDYFNVSLTFESGKRFISSWVPNADTSAQRAPEQEMMAA